MTEKLKTTKTKTWSDGGGRRRAYVRDMAAVIVAESPPPLEWFRNCPTPEDMEGRAQVGVYALLLENLHCKPALYVGSSLSLKDRWKDYVKGHELATKEEGQSDRKEGTFISNNVFFEIRRRLMQ